MVLVVIPLISLEDLAVQLSENEQKGVFLHSRLSGSYACPRCRPGSSSEHAVRNIAIAK